MAGEDELGTYLADILPQLDERVAAEGTLLWSRPTRAALLFVKLFVLEVGGNNQAIDTGEPTADILGSDWFRPIYAAVEEWYRRRYGQAFEGRKENSITGVVLIFKTAFRLNVPVVVRSTGEANTVWIRFPTELLDQEDVLGWIESPPNFASVSEAERRKLLRLAAEIACTLRRIRNTLVGVELGTPRFEGLKAGIMPRLEQAAALIASRRPDAVQLAYWEMQVACEHALKLLELQSAGSFTETHDLFVLYDRTQPPPSFTRNTLKGVPRWEEMIELRYGQGNRTDIGECFAAYRKALVIVAGSVIGLRHLKMSDARFQLQAPPWMRD